MDLVYNVHATGSVANPSAIPGKYIGWPDNRLAATPPPPPQKPILSLAAPFVPRGTGPATLA